MPIPGVPVWLLRVALAVAIELLRQWLESL